MSHSSIPLISSPPVTKHSPLPSPTSLIPFFATDQQLFNQSRCFPRVGFSQCDINSLSSINPVDTNTTANILEDFSHALANQGALWVNTLKFSRRLWKPSRVTLPLFAVLEPMLTTSLKLPLLPPHQLFS